MFLVLGEQHVSQRRREIPRDRDVARRDQGERHVTQAQVPRKQAHNIHVKRSLPQN